MEPQNIQNKIPNIPPPTQAPIAEKPKRKIWIIGSIFFDFILLPILGILYLIMQDFYLGEIVFNGSNPYNKYFTILYGIILFLIWLTRILRNKISFLNKFYKRLLIQFLLVCLCLFLDNSLWGYSRRHYNPCVRFASLAVEDTAFEPVYKNCASIYK